MPSKKHVVVAGVAGALAGAVAIYVALSSANSNAVGIYAAYELVEHERAAVDAFASLEPKGALEFQRLLLRYADRQHEMNWIGPEDYHRVVGYGHARSAQALIELGDTVNAEKELQEALTALSRIGISAPKEELLAAVRKSRGVGEAPR